MIQQRNQLELGKYYQQRNHLKLCEYYQPGRKCSLSNSPCGQKLETKDGSVCCSDRYYAMSLEKRIEQLERKLQTNRVD